MESYNFQPRTMLSEVRTRSDNFTVFPFILKVKQNRRLPLHFFILFLLLFPFTPVKCTSLFSYNFFLLIFAFVFIYSLLSFLIFSCSFDLSSFFANLLSFHSFPSIPLSSLRPFPSPSSCLFLTFPSLFLSSVSSLQLPFFLSSLMTSPTFFFRSVRRWFTLRIFLLSGKQSQKMVSMKMYVRKTSF